MVSVKKIFMRVLAVCLSAFLTFIVADKISIHFLSHRRSALERQLNVQDIRYPKPYVMFSGVPLGESWPLINKDGSVKNIKLNLLGYRGDVPVRPKPQDEYRVIVLGGSTVFSGHPPIPRLLQYQFEKQDCQNVKVYNFGVVSSVSGMELARLVFEAVDYEPDLIISYGGFNDIDQPFSADPRPGYPFNFMVYENNPILESDIKTYPLFPLIAYGSNLARYFFPHYFMDRFGGIKALREKVGYDSEPWRQKTAQIYLNNMVKSQKISRAYGAEFLAVFQPALYFKDQLSDSEQGLVHKARMNNSVSMRGLVRQAAVQAQKQDDLSFIDLSDVFDENPEAVFKDRVHLRKYYRPVIARRLYDLIKGQIKTRGFCVDKGEQMP